METELNTKLLQETVSKMMARGKGLLAADESNKTAGKRLATIDTESTEETRRQYRELFLEMPEVENYVSGVILYDETFWQKNNEDVLFVKSLEEREIVPGIKVDGGTEEFPGSPDEKITYGLDGLDDRAKNYFDNGARFTKWRAVIKIDQEKDLPTDKAIEENADNLAQYANIVQQAGLVPVVEPEVLLEGEHSLELAEKVTTKVVRTVFDKLREYKVYIPGLILKTSMVINGNKNSDEASAQEVADATVRMLNNTVPKDVGGVVFLSGGQTAIEATEHLNAIAESEDKLPFEIAFSYARALQGPALRAWQGKPENVEAGRTEFLKRLKLNQLADEGDYEMEYEYID